MWTPLTPSGATHHFQRGRRTISPVVLDARVDITSLSADHDEAWSTALSTYMLCAGDIVNLNEVRPELCPVENVVRLQQQMRAWRIPTGEHPPVALACRGAGYHHDADDYPDKGFCVLWLSEDAGWELAFPFLSRRIALRPGTVVLFDSAQPHAVLPQGKSLYDPDDFAHQDLGIFLSQDFPLERIARRRLGIETLSRYGRKGLVPLGADGVQQDLDIETGRWHTRKIR